MRELVARASTFTCRLQLKAVNDDRALLDPGLRLFLVADASGPTYGGYHEAVGIAPGLLRFTQELRNAQNTGVSFNKQGQLSPKKGLAVSQADVLTLRRHSRAGPIGAADRQTVR